LLALPGLLSFWALLAALNLGTLLAPALRFAHGSCAKILRVEGQAQAALKARFRRWWLLHKAAFLVTRRSAKRAMGVSA